MDKNKVVIVLTLIAIIAVTFTATLYIYMHNNNPKHTIWSGTQYGFQSISGINISPTIYSPQNNIAILNELAIFNVTIYNYADDTLVVKLSVIGDDNLVYNESFNISNQSVRTMIVSEKISYSGLWLVTAASNDTRMGSTYSFQAVTNAEEANGQINSESNLTNQQNSTNYSNTLALTAIVMSTIFGLATLTIAIFAYRRKKED